jgi:hypothetical protein
MPLCILLVAISIGYWFPRGDAPNRNIERWLREALFHECDTTAPAPIIRWALPIVQDTFGAAASHWCAGGVDPAAVTITQTHTEDGGWSITLHAPHGSSIHLLLTIGPSGVPLVSSVAHDPAGTSIPKQVDMLIG